MKKHIRTISILVSLLTACSSAPKQALTEAGVPQLPYTIDLSEVDYSESPQLLSDFVESIEYIKLSEEPLVTDARKINLFEEKKSKWKSAIYDLKK